MRKINTSKQRARRVIMIVAAILALVPLGAGTAHATPGDVTPLAVNFNGVCEVGEYCLFRDTADWDGIVIDYGAAGNRTCDTTYSNNNFPTTTHPVNDEVSSWWNRLSGITVREYAGLRYTGASLPLPPGSRGNFRDTVVGNDEASSHRSLPITCLV
jgi:hypothetical protein